jgi:DNA (cytosine-5)-methyltransferase 1
MKAISLFSGAGIGESRLSEIGVEVLVANELVDNRARLYGLLDSKSKMIPGDITDKNIFDSILSLVPSKLDLLIATPPCQGVSVAGKNRLAKQQMEDERNYLLFPILKFIKETNPRYILIENVPQYLKLLLPHKGKLRTVEEILNLEFSSEYHIESQIINCSDLGVPQSRKRAFIKLFKKGKQWEWPKRVQSPKLLEEVIGHLPSLESGEVSGIPWHFARNHSSEHIRWMQNTPTGHSAFENPVHFPKGKDGKPIKAYSTTYRRMSWDKPAPAITMRNDAISSQMNVHPGRKKSNGKYSDARVLTPLELLIVNSMNIKQWEKIVAEEVLVRRVLGEGVPPLALNKIIQSLTRTS